MKSSGAVLQLAAKLELANPPRIASSFTSHEKTKEGKALGRRNDGVARGRESSARGRPGGHFDCANFELHIREHGGNEAGGRGEKLRLHLYAPRKSHAR